jgi:hypothetical protein
MNEPAWRALNLARRLTGDRPEPADGLIGEHCKCLAVSEESWAGAQ